MQFARIIAIFVLVLIHAGAGLPTNNSSRPSLGFQGHELPVSSALSTLLETAARRSVETFSRHSESRLSSIGELSSSTSGMCLHTHSMSGTAYLTHSMPCVLTKMTPQWETRIQRTTQRSQPTGTQLIAQSSQVRSLFRTPITRGPPEASIAVSLVPTVTSIKSLPFHDTYIQLERPFSHASCGTDICDVMTDTRTHAEASTTRVEMITQTINRANPSYVLVNQTETWKAGNTITVTTEIWMLPTEAATTESSVASPPTPLITSARATTTKPRPFYDTYIQSERPFSHASCGTEFCDVVTETATRSGGGSALTTATTTRTINRANPSYVLVYQTETWKARNTITVTTEVWMLPATETASEPGMTQTLSQSTSVSN